MNLNMFQVNTLVLKPILMVRIVEDHIQFVLQSEILTVAVKKVDEWKNVNLY